MRISMTFVAVIVALLVVVIDHQLELGFVDFLADFFVVLIVVAIVFGVIGLKTKV